MTRLRIVCCLCLWPALVPERSAAAASDDAKAYVTRSFAAEEQVPRKRSEIVQTRNGVTTRYLIEHVRPGRARMVITETGKPASEVVALNDHVYLKVRGAWQKSPMPVRPGAMPSLLDGFFSRVSSVVEEAPRRQQGVDLRVFTTQLSLKASSGMTVGAMEIVIDPATNLPAATAFSGQCGSVPCSFSQTFSYGADIVIEAPVN